jgi:hypothetical protein
MDWWDPVHELEVRSQSIFPLRMASWELDERSRQILIAAKM